MALTKATYSMIAGAPANVNDYGAVGDGTTDDTAAIQAAIDTGFDVVFPNAAYKITAPLQVGSQRLLGGVQNKAINRSQTRIIVPGNHATFVNKASFPSFQIDGFFIFYGNTTPTVIGTDGGKTAFLFETNSSSWPEFIHISNCTVQGAWYGFFDNTGTYLSKLTQVACRNTRTGFYKDAGTTIEFDTCSSSDGIAGFYISNCISPSLLNCSADGLTVTAGNTGNYFSQITSLVINGWDGESNSITGNGASYMLFNTTTGVVNAFSGVTNSLTATAGEEVYFIYCTDNSFMTFNGFKVNRDTTWLTYTGTGGTCFTLKAFNTGSVVLVGSDFSAPTSGSPSARYSVGGFNNAWIDLIETFTNNLTAGIAFSSYAGVVKIAPSAGAVGFFGKAPATLQSPVGSVAITTAGSTNTVFRDTTFTGSTGTTAYSIGDLVAALKNYGLLAS
jgi:hypothetical protein